MKKKLILLMLTVSAVSLFAMTACGKTASGTDTGAATDSTTQGEETVATEADATETDAADTDSDAGEQATTGLANPMVQVTGAQDFKSKLGISIDMDQISLTPDAYYIIADQTAQIDFTTTNVNGEDTALCLRATKDETVKDNPVESLAGIYDTNLSEGNTVEVDGIEFTSYNANTLKTTIYSWKVGDTYFTFSIGDGMSQMSIASMMDEMAAATK